MPTKRKVPPKAPAKVAPAPKAKKAPAPATKAAKAAPAPGKAKAAPPPPKRPRGRPDTFDQVLADAIAQRLADGQFLRAICREEGMPPWRTVYGWIEAREDFAAQIARARDVGYDAIAEDSLVMLDEKPRMAGSAFGDKVDPGHVAWQKNRAEQRLKLLAKWSPKKYGEATTLRHEGKVTMGVEMESDQALRVAHALIDGIKDA